eukprot:PITA_12397
MGKVIKPSHSLIIVEEECEPSRRDARGSKVATMPTTTDIEEDVTSDPPYPQRLVELGMNSQPESNFLRELQNLHVRIPLLQALKGVPIYAKIVRYLCIKKPGRKPKDPATIHVMGKLSELMFAQPLLPKYNDPGNPTVTIYINDQPIANTLIDLEAAINVMAKDLFTTLGLRGFRHTPTVLELANKSRVKPEGVLEDIVITIASWRYLDNFLILQPKSNLGGTSFDLRETLVGH